MLKSRIEKRIETERSKPDYTSKYDMIKLFSESKKLLYFSMFCMDITALETFRKIHSWRFIAQQMSRRNRIRHCGNGRE